MQNATETTVLTLIAPQGRLAPPLVHRIAAALHATPAWLAEAEAADLLLPAPPEPSLLAALMHGTDIDHVLQPLANRRKRLLVADMDSTIVTTETLDELAAHAGMGDRVAAITTRSMRGELDFRAALIERVALLRGLPAEALEATWNATQTTEGAAELVATMAAHGAVCALVSGGFTWFTERLAAQLGFHSHHANHLLIENGALTGHVAEPILGRQAKAATLRALAAEHAIPLAQTMAVGDGANDLDMLNLAGIGIAYHAKPIVAATARARIDHSTLRALLFLQGYAPALGRGWRG